MRSQAAEVQCIDPTAPLKMDSTPPTCTISCRRLSIITTSRLPGRLNGIRSLFFLRDEKGEVLGGLLGDIWAAWLHVRTLAAAAPVRGRGFGRELMKRAELYAVERLPSLDLAGRKRPDFDSYQWQPALEFGLMPTV
jgi:GNAT superfamily N-acetyltransferase